MGSKGMGAFASARLAGHRFVGKLLRPFSVFRVTKNRKRLGLIALAACLPITAQAVTSNVGATAGSFSVSPTGAATYSIPIAVPPGTAGMQPNLSLNYNSQGSNGLLGMGWSLGGLSSITRCPQTVAQDGVKGGVNLDANDRFCLDGQRLIPINGGANGGAATEYRTERESFTRVISYGSQGTGPAYFKAWTKSGQIMEFGVTADSRIEAQGKTSVMVWALDRVQDTVGNYLTVTYTEDNANGQYYPSRIDYTGNANTGTPTYNSVQFTPVTRTDITPLYQAGSMIKNTVLLSNIKTFTGTTLVRDYVLKYDPSASTNRSRLTSLTECVGDGMCLPATAFGWLGTGTNAFDTNVVGTDVDGSGWASSVYPRVFADINGDGRADLVLIEASEARAYVFLGRSDGSFEQLPVSTDVSGSGWVASVYPRHFADINGDGRTDLVLIEASEARAYVFLGRSDGSFEQLPVSTDVSGSGWVASVYPRVFADINGDGRTDLVLIEASEARAYVFLGRSDGSFEQLPVSTDVNGSGWSKGAYTRYLTDVNGDGKIDLVLSDNLEAIVYAFLSKGDGSFALDPMTTNVNGSGWVASAYPRSFLDINGDGKSDLVLVDQSEAAIFAFIANGDGTFALNPVSTDINGSGWNGNYYKRYFADVNGDGKQDLVLLPDDEAILYVSRSNFPVDLIASVVNGLVSTTTLTYKPLTDASVYTKESGDPYPTLDFQGPMYVVSDVTTSNGIGGTAASSYHYGGARIDLSGRGFLGFRWTQADDATTGASTLTTYAQAFPYTGMASSVQRHVAGVLISQVANAFNVQPAQYAGVSSPYVSSSTEQSWDINGVALPSVTTSTVLDTYGNPTQITVATSDGYTKTTTNTYTNDTASWILGRLTSATVASAIPGGASQTRASSFAYNAANGLLTQEVIEPGNAALRLQTDYTYDAFGNKTSVTVSGADIATRTTRTAYDAQGRFPTSSSNALNQSETRVYDPRFGTLTSLTGPNILTTQWAYDGFGRKVSETRADGTTTTVSHDWGGVGSYTVTSTSSGTPPVKVHYDILNREVRSEGQGFDGTAIYKDTAYNTKGQVDHVTRPYFANAAPVSIGYVYDPLGRTVEVDTPDSGGAIARATTDYNGLTTTITDPNGHAVTRTKNSQGQLLQVIDAKNGITSYAYDPFGNLLKTTDAKGNLVQMAYDLRGRKTVMDDPDMGHWTYQYNAIGDLIKQTDAKGQVVTMAYDLLGRMVTRSEPDMIGTWTYDTAPNGKGKLAKATADNGYQRTYTYDALGRVARESTTIDTLYNVDTAYDTLGRMSQITYPTGFAVKNTYNAQGYLSQVNRVDNNALLWQGTAKNADGQLIRATLGNGVINTNAYDPYTGRVQTIAVGSATSSNIQYNTYSFDAVGNLKQRTDLVRNVTDNFGYDEINRLTSATSNGVATNYAYDSIGNITNKSDAGAYVYGSSRPHAVTAVNGTVTAAYVYDANGNLSSGAGRVVEWSSFNMPTSIALGASNIAFVYDAEHGRIREISSDGKSTIFLSPRIDAGIHFEKEIQGTLTSYKHYLYAGGRAIGVYTTRSNGVNDTRYFHGDHIGSIAVVTNEVGGVVARYAYDPFGKRITVAGDTNATHHGFTGHEQLDEVGLVHMNGRVYDPVLGRFMSADPHIQAPGNGQSYNRYSYTMNNPLSFTDPSGYSWWTKFRDNVVKPVVVAVVAYYTGGAAYSAYMGSAVAEAGGAMAITGAQVAAAQATATVIAGAAGGATAGIVGTALNGGSFSDAARAGVIGGITGAIFGGVTVMTAEWNAVGQTIAQGVTGGATAEMQGGRFGDGFRYSSFSKAADLAYTSVVGYETDPTSGGNAVDKADPLAPPVRRANNIGVISPTASTNPCFLCEGGPVSRVLNQIPGVNAVAGLHDQVQNYVLRNGGGMFDSISNVPTMPLAAALTYPALLKGPLSVQLAVDRSR